MATEHQSPAAQNKQGIVCIAFKPMEKNTLRGFATLQLLSGLIIVDASLHEKENKRWVSMPSRPWTDKQNQIKYAAIVDFIDNDTRYRFSAAAVAAIDAFIAEQGERRPQPSKAATDDPWGDFGQ